MARTMNHNKSIFVKLVRYFVLLFLIQFSLFGALSKIYQNKLLHEMEKKSGETLRQLCGSFTNEFVRLDSLLTSCMSDRTMNLAVFGRLPDESFRDYAGEAAEKLLLMRNALPYAENLFAYTASRDLVIRHGGGYVEKDVYASNTLKLTQEESRQLWERSTGFYSIGGKNFYIKKFHSYGFVAVQIDMDLFGNIQNSLDPQYQFVVVDRSGELVMKNRSFQLEDGVLEKLSAEDAVVNGKVEYTLLRSRLTAYSMTGILLRDATEYRTLQRYFFLVILVSGVLLIVSFLSLLLLNIKIYVPLKKLTQRFGDGRKNEIELVEEKMNDLLYELYLLSKNNAHSQSFVDMALQYLLYGGTQLQAGDLQVLREKYPCYRVFALVIQNDSGEGGVSLLAEAEQSLLAVCDFDLIRLDAYKAALIVPEEAGEKAMEALGRMMEFHPQYRLYAGALTGCTDVGTIHESYQEAEKRLRACRLCAGPPGFSACTQEVKPETTAAIGFTRLSELVHAGDETAFRKFLEERLYSGPATLGDAWELYTEVLAAFKSFPQLCSLSFSVSASGERLYHPEYLLDRLCRYYASLNTLLEGGTAGNSCVDIIQYVNSHYAQVLSLEIVAEAFDLNPVYLSNMFKKNTGVNFSAYVSKLRMDKAILLIQESASLKIYEIAERVGIDNPATFIRQFKKYTGVTPVQYRRNYRLRQNQDENE